MNKYEFTWSCRDNNAFGFISDTECMYMIIDKWTEENDGHMDADELADMVEYLEDEMEWYWMAHMMHGYFWGAAIDDKYELLGEQLRNNKPTEREIYELQHPSDEVRRQQAIEARNETPDSVLSELYG